MNNHVHGLNFPASHSHIWTVCVGQPQLVKRIDFSEPQSQSAIEGIVADWVVGLYLQNMPVVATERNGVYITEEMHDGAKLFRDHVNSVLDNCSSACRKLIPGNIQYYVFVNWLLPSVNKQVTDLRHYDAGNKTLHIWEYKYGHEYVEVVENTQCIFYALDSATKDVVENIVVYVVQPRSFSENGPIRSWSFNRTVLNEWAGKFKHAYTEAHRIDAPLTVGKHCKRCKARGLCPALYNEVLKLATVLDAPASLTAAEVGERLRLMELLNARSGEAKSALHAQGVHYIQKGEELPGWKLIPKTTQRKLSDENKLIAMFVMNGGNPDDLYKRDLKPLTQLEKLLTPKIVDACTTKPKGALVLVQNDHPSEGFENKAAAVFNTIPVKPTGVI